MKKLLIGNEAVARGLYEGGVHIVSSYPGTPSTEITEFLSKYDDIHTEWAPNEKVAMEVAFGASLGGARSACAMKHVGLNVAADPLFTLSYTGVTGGMVVCVADDPAMHSSQNEQDSRHYAVAAKVPMLEPSDSAECYGYAKAALELSERFDTPVILRVTTRIAHSQSIVDVGERENVAVKDYVKNPQKYIMMPAMAKKRHPIVEERTAAIAEFAEDCPFNKVEMGGTEIGIVTAGDCYQYVKEAMGDTASILKLGIVNPLPKQLICDFVAKCDEVYIFEELEPVIEEQVRSWRLRVHGKEKFTKQGEYSANMLKKVIYGKDEIAFDKAEAPARPPILCPGCPHRSVFSVLNKLKIHAAGDIGCYTLGAVAPLNVIDTTVCMGSSISILHGMEKAKGKEFIKNWVATIGDSTFLHTGVNSLINMVYNKATGTVMILDNRTTGMTGHQEHAATGKTLKGEDTYAIDLAELCRSIGVKRVIEVNAFDIKELERIIKESVNGDELTVIIAKAPCALIKGQKFPDVCRCTPEDCRKCGMCLKIGCPALTKQADGTVKIDETMCNGCGLCMSYCKFGAIKKVAR